MTDGMATTGKAARTAKATEDMHSSLDGWSHSRRRSRAAAIISKTHMLESLSQASSDVQRTGTAARSIQKAN